jgi:hypothetical protein
MRDSCVVRFFAGPSPSKSTRALRSGALLTVSFRAKNALWRYLAGDLPDSKVKLAEPTRRRLPKMPATPDASDLQEQSSIYLKERNKATQLKRTREEMLLTQAREELIGAAAVDFLVAFR